MPSLPSSSSTTQHVHPIQAAAGEAGQELSLEMLFQMGSARTNKFGAIPFYFARVFLL